MQHYDYIVIGGGSAGCVLAGELSADPSVRVLLLEAGPAAEDNPETLRADGYKQAFVNDAVVWQRRSAPQRGCGGMRLFMGSGTGLGGSGSINAMMYLRASAADFAMWGLDDWRWSEVCDEFERLERALNTSQHEVNPFSETCIEAAEAVGFRRSADVNSGDLHNTLGYQPMNYHGDERRSSYVAFVKPNLGRPNLVVISDARVHRLVFDGARRAALGVVYEHAGARFQARARGETILAAGALETPKLLMLSGIGPAAQLRSCGIEPLLDQPAVGANFHDHPGVTLFFRGQQPTTARVPTPYGFFRANPDSDLPPDASDTCFVFYPARSSLREGMMRLLPVIALQGPLYDLPVLRRSVRDLVGKVFDQRWVQRTIERVYGVVVILGKPKSRGTVKLVSASAEQPLSIDPAYLTDPEDIQTLLRGVELARRVAGAPAFTRWGNRELLPGPLFRTPRALEWFIRRNAMTIYHYAGTCKMGRNASAVVDDQLRVIGAERLRIADASVIPTLPVSAINAPSMLIGMRCARLLREQRAATRAAC